VRDALQEGRISLEEMDSRLERVYKAQSYGDLDSAMGDLPAWVAYRRPAPAMQMPYTVPAPSSYRRRIWLRPLVTVLVLWWVFSALAVTAAHGSGVGMGLFPICVVAAAALLFSRRGSCSARRRMRAVDQRNSQHLPPPGC